MKVDIYRVFKNEIDEVIDWGPDACFIEDEVKKLYDKKRPRTPDELPVDGEWIIVETYHSGFEVGKYWKELNQFTTYPWTAVIRWWPVSALLGVENV